MNKYRNIKTIVDDIAFDSKKEACRYQELKLMEKACQLSDLELQPKFELVPSFTDAHGGKHRAITYTADFQYVVDGVIIVEDVKGKKTEVYKIKKKLLLFTHDDFIFQEI